MSSLRSIRIANIAVADLVLSVAAFYVALSVINKQRNPKASNQSIFALSLTAIPVGMLVHYVFNIPTTLNKSIGL